MVLNIVRRIQLYNPAPNEGTNLFTTLKATVISRFGYLSVKIRSLSGNMVISPKSVVKLTKLGGLHAIPLLDLIAIKISHGEKINIV